MLASKKFTVDSKVKAKSHNTIKQDREILCFDLDATAGSESSFTIVQTTQSGCCFLPGVPECHAMWHWGRVAVITPWLSWLGYATPDGHLALQKTCQDLKRNQDHNESNRISYLFIYCCFMQLNYMCISVRSPRPVTGFQPVTLLQDRAYKE